MTPTVPLARGDEAAVEFLDQLYRDIEHGWISLFSVDRTTGDRHVDWAPIDRLDELAATAVDRTDNCCVWFGVATRHRQLEAGRRGGAEDCNQLTALWVDIDIAGPGHADNERLPKTFEQGWALVRSFPLPATCTINSGGGLQAWWFLDEPLAADDATRLLERWAATWANRADERDVHIDSVFDLARVMRLPGTLNRKTIPIEVRILDVDWERRYGTDDLEPWLDNPRRPATPERSAPYIGPARPGDAYNVAHSGAEVLAELGFAFARRDRNGDEHWVRPGKETRDGTSATIYAEDGHTTIWSDTAAAMWPALDVRRPYDPFGLLVATKYGGDFARAGSELRLRGYGDTPDLTSWAQPTTSQPAVDIETADNTPPTIELPPDLGDFLDSDDPEYLWAIEGVAERGDRIILTGYEGKGKSTLLRQIGIQVASGVHPFTHQPIEPMRVLYIDCENSVRQLRREFRKLWPIIEDTYAHGALRVHVVNDVLELGKPPVYESVAMHVRAYEPHIIIVGPLYKMIDGDPIKEEPAKNLAAALDRLRHLCDSVLFIEAHSPYPETSRAKRLTRVYGASLWSRWPEFGIHLTEDGAIEHWRGNREERQWPTKLDRGQPWPWMPGQETGTTTEEGYSGPTHCASAVVDVLAAHAGIEVSGNRLIDLMKAAGHAFHDKTIRAGAELAAGHGRIRSRPGPNRSRIYWYDEQGTITDEPF